jgi:hypothetical protein
LVVLERSWLDIVTFQLQIRAYFDY